MKLILPASLLFALATTLSVAAQSREYTLDINVSNNAGVSLANAPYHLRNNLYDVDYNSTETKLDATGHSSIRTYGGSHTLRISVPGLRTYSSTFDITADTHLDIVLEEDIRTPYSLHANLAHDAYTGRNDIVMDWNSEEAVFFDDFESYTPFSIDPQPWTGIDVDGIPAGGMEGSYDNREKRQYITIANPSAVVPAWDVQYYYTMAPDSGKQYAAFIQPSSGNNNDWFITPLIEVGEDNILRFHMRRADAGDARLRVAITTAENPSPSDFITISEGNYLSPGYEEWQEVKIPLANYAGKSVRIGFHCTSRNGAVMTMLDDVFVGRINAAARSQRVVRRSAENPNEKFEIYLDGNKVAETTEYGYIVENVGNGQHTVGVKAVLNTGSSDTATATVTVDNSQYVKTVFTASTNNGRDTQGVILSVAGDNAEYTLDLSNGRGEFAALPKGDYTALIETEGYEKITKLFTADGDKTIDLLLTERIVMPFNITADVAEVDGKFDVTVNWNRDLGFVESFEDYTDFATGSFGGWTTLNFNGEHQASYPISINGREVQFNGCSLSSSPKSVPPMVFNPKSTRPSLGEDGAFAAPYGDKYLAFMGPQQNRADKWAISPEIKIYENYRLSLVAKGYPIYPETLQFLISTNGGIEPQDFELLDEVVVPYDEWVQYIIDLKDYAGKAARIAVRCVTMDGFVALVDDIRVEPNDETTDRSAGFVTDYSIRLDNNQSANTTNTRHIYRNVEAGVHTVGIRANYVTGSSDEAQYQFNTSSSVDGIVASADIVIGTSGAILITTGETSHADVYTLSGTRIATVDTAGTHCIAADSGIYIVKLNSEAIKVIVR